MTTPRRCSTKIIPISPCPVPGSRSSRSCPCQQCRRIRFPFAGRARLALDRQLPQIGSELMAFYRRSLDTHGEANFARCSAGAHGGEASLPHPFEERLPLGSSEHGIVEE